MGNSTLIRVKYPLIDELKAIQKRGKKKKIIDTSDIAANILRVHRMNGKKLRRKIVEEIEY